jgi:V/A-type H+-transporting ATPase subunit D
MAETEIQATRSQLLETRKRIVLSKRGYSLLKMKRDGLMMEFMKVLKEARGLRGVLVTSYLEAVKAISVAEAVEGKITVESLIYAIRATPEISISDKNLMGVKVPTINILSKSVGYQERGYGIIGTTIRMDLAVGSSMKLMEIIEKAAEVETSLRKLLDEIEKVKRRVNALEFRVIPSLEETESFIRLRLEEMERENIFRLKRIKGRIS